MFVLGLLLLAAAVVAGVEVVLANREPFVLHMWSWTWHVDAFWLAVAGAVIVTAAWLGLGAMRVGAGHNLRLRRDRRRLAAENRELAARTAPREPAPVGGPGAALSDGSTPAGDATAARAEEPAETRPGFFGRHSHRQTNPAH